MKSIIYTVLLMMLPVSVSSFSDEMVVVEATGAVASTVMLTMA